MKMRKITALFATLALFLAFSPLGHIQAADQRIQYNEQMVGANHPTKADTLNRALMVDHNSDGTHEKLTVGSDADGDMYYRAAGVLARLPKGAENLKLFTNAAGSAPEWASGFKITTATRDLSASAGAVNYTGVGFKPSAVIVLTAINGSTYWSVGAQNGTDAFCIAMYADASVNNYSFLVHTRGPGGYQQGSVTTWLADGATITWEKSSAPTGVAGITLIWMR